MHAYRDSTHETMPWISKYALTVLFGEAGFIPSKYRQQVPLTFLAVLAFMGFSVFLAAAPAEAQLSYQTLDYGTNATFLTGIRGDNIVGNYVIPDGAGNTGGLLYNLSTGAWTLFPTPTVNGASFPGAVGSSPYGPSVGSEYGILNTVGSYKTAASSPYDLSYLYNAAQAPSGSLTTLAYPGTPGTLVLDTIAHSTFGDQVVGNYDTRLAAGNAFIYKISTGTYTANNFPGALSTTAYGVWGDKIAGGYAPRGIGFERGYIYDQTNQTWQTFNHPGAVFTHFEGITGAGRGGQYNLVADWAGPDGTLHASVLHLGPGGSQSWIDYGVPGATLTSANSIYQNRAIGIYVDANGFTNGYTVSIPGIYNPLTNFGVLDAGSPNIPALAGGAGDDVVNTGVIHTSSINSSGIRGNSFGIISNNGSITVSGIGSAGVEMNGAYGTLLNAGSIAAAPGGEAIRTGPAAIGSAIVNNGIIDGQVAMNAGPTARFENSGWLGISAAGAGTTHVISGAFVQTATGTLGLRIAPGSNDRLQVGGAALLGGTLAPQISATPNASPPLIGRQVQIISATNGISGSFATVTQPGGPLSEFRFDALYAPTEVNLVITPSSYGSFAGNQWNASVGRALDTVRPAVGVVMTSDQSALYAPLYSLSAGQIVTALQQLASVIYSDTLMINRGTFQMVTGVINSELQARRGAPAQNGSRSTKGPDGTTIWLSGMGQFINLNSTGNGAPGYNGSSGGVVAGIDGSVMQGVRVGLAVGFNSQSINTANAATYSGQSTQVQIYGTASHDILFLDGQAGALFNEGTARRTLSAQDVATNGDVTGPGFGASARGGIRLNVNGWNIEPSVMLSGLSLHQDGLTETGGGPVGVAVNGNSIASVQTLVGVQVDHRFAINATYAVVPSVQVGWAYETMNTQARTTASFVGAPGSAFTLSNPSIGRSAAVVGMHAVLESDIPLQIFAGYDAAFNDRSAAQTIIAGIRYIW